MAEKNSGELQFILAKVRSKEDTPVLLIGVQTCTVSGDQLGKFSLRFFLFCFVFCYTVDVSKVMS